MTEMFVMFFSWCLYVEVHLIAIVAGNPSIVERRATSGPLALPPSEYWDGNDGLWSSFAFQVGTPPQAVRLLPSTNTNAVWLVLSEGCTYQDPSDCAMLRGFEYVPSASSTFDRVGNSYFELDYEAAQALGYFGNAEVGYDNITLGWPGAGMPSVDHQIVQGFAAQFPFLGILGLSPRSINLTSFNNESSTLLTTLRADGTILSTSWSYTAGSDYSNPPVFGSLTLGGYDTTRFTPNNISFPFGADIAYDLLVAIQSIHSNATDVLLLASGVFALIDSLVTTIWLPLTVCEAFEEAFNLTWNDTAQMYLLDNDTHEALRSRNPSITFTLSSTLSSTNTVDIVLPYASFDLQVLPPLVDTATWYFPLQRAENDTQYILGRTFLQEAYVIADYDRSVFSVSQALFPSTSVAQNLIAIHAPASSQHKGMKAGTIAGIAVGILAVVTIACLIGFPIYRRCRARQGASQSQSIASVEHYEKAMLDGKELAGRAAADQPGELPSPAGIEMRHEMDGSNPHTAEMPGEEQGIHALRRELPAGKLEEEIARRAFH